MSNEITSNNPSVYAKYFVEVDLTGTRWLQFRDIPELVRKYVKGTTALDYGCGPGMSTRFLKSLGFEVDGVDINEHMIKLAKEVDPNGNYVVIESGNIPAKDHHYDLVFCNCVLPYISSKQEMLKVTKEIARVLKKGGIFIVTVTSEDTFSQDWLSLSTEFEENKNLFSGSSTILQYKDNGLKFCLFYWTDDDYKNILESAGFELLYVNSPLGRSSDGYLWISETEKHYSTTYVTRNGR